VAVQKWLNETYPEIQQRTKEEDAEINRGDETAMVNTNVRGRGYAPKGDTPVAYVVGGTQQKLSPDKYEVLDGFFLRDRLWYPASLDAHLAFGVMSYAACRCFPANA
jgi:hypothetical protein